MKLFWSDPLSVFSAILDSTFDRWHDSAHAWDHKNNMADFMGDEAKKIQYFPDGSLLNTMIISIIDSEKRYTDILKEPYTVYLIETKWVFVFRAEGASKFERVTSVLGKLISRRCFEVLMY